MSQSPSPIESRDKALPARPQRRRFEPGASDRDARGILNTDLVMAGFGADFLGEIVQTGLGEEAMARFAPLYLQAMTQEARASQGESETAVFLARASDSPFMKGVRPNGPSVFGRLGR